MDGKGNGNPLQYSCLENPVDRGAWWAAIYGVAQSRTRLKQLSSSSGNLWKGTLASLYINGSQLEPGENWSHTEQVAISEDVFGYENRGGGATEI